MPRDVVWEFLAPKPFKSAMGDAHLEFSPVGGVLLSIRPWNYLYYQLSRFPTRREQHGSPVFLMWIQREDRWTMN